MAGEVIDPYVSVRIRGHSDDMNEGTQFKTEIVHNNGFNPVWNAKTAFTITVPDLAMLEFKVKDHAVTGANSSIGSFACPVNALKSGEFCAQ